MATLLALTQKQIKKIKGILLTIMVSFLISFYCPSWAEVTIEHLTEDLLVFDQGENRGLLIIGSKGIAVIDPLNQKAALVLKDFIAENYTQTVTHVIYTHSHWDRITGGKILKNKEHHLLQTKNVNYFCLAMPTQMLSSPMFISTTPMLLN